MSPSLAKMLELRASETPVQPWIFFPSGWQWRWFSWQEGLTAFQEVRTALDEAFSDPVDASHLVLDPVTTPGNLLLLIGASERGIPWATLPPVERPLEEGAILELEYRTERPPHDRIQIRARRLSAAEPIEERAVPPAVALAASPERPRDVTFVTGDLGSPAALSLLHWALESGAALALEHDAAARLQALLWLRPHVALVDDQLEQQLATTVGLGQTHPTRAQRRARQQMRLRALVGPGLEQRAEAWRELAIEVHDLA